MDGETKSPWAISIIGSIIGGIIVFLLLRNQLESQKMALQLQKQQIYQYQQMTQQPMSIQQKSAPIINAGYKNDEKWVIERGSDGHIKTLQIVRDAKVRSLG